MKKKSNPRNLDYIPLAIFMLVAGFAIGFLSSNIAKAKPASAQDIERAKIEIAKLYEGKTVDACWTVNDGTNLAADKYELTYRHLRINKYTNRAIITDCSNFDTLLYKNASGRWTQSSVNLQINNRVNPIWQKECEIEDITVADEIVRPENSSIDEMNLNECRELKQL